MWLSVSQEPVAPVSEASCIRHARNASGICGHSGGSAELMELKGGGGGGKIPARRPASRCASTSSSPPMLVEATSARRGPPMARLLSGPPAPHSSWRTASRPSGVTGTSGMAGGNGVRAPSRPRMPLACRPAPIAGLLEVMASAEARAELP